MTRLSHLARTVVLALFLPVLLLGMTAPASVASAEGAQLQADPTEGLNPDGHDLTVTGTGFQDGIGLFVVLCDPAIRAGGACDMANFQQVTTDADGAFETTLHVVPGFGSTDCMVTPCAVQTSKVGDGADRTQERTVPISFEGGVPAENTMADPPASEEDTEPAAADSDESEDSNTQLIVIVAVVAAVLLVAGAFLATRRRRQ